LAKGVAKHRGIRGIFVHTDNERTDLLLQEGIMRNDARKRIIKETNRRLVDLFAESGVGAVGMQWHQMGKIDAEDVLTFHNDPRTRIPHSTQLILSNLGDDSGGVVQVEHLAEMVSNTLALPLIKVNATYLDGIFVQKERELGSSAVQGDFTGSTTIQNINMDTWNTLDHYILGA
jgi:hypothetical protein